MTLMMITMTIMMMTMTMIMAMMVMIATLAVSKDVPSTLHLGAACQQQTDWDCAQTNACIAFDRYNACKETVARYEMQF